MNPHPRLVVCEGCRCHIKVHERRCPLCRHAVDRTGRVCVVGIALALGLPGCRGSHSVAPTVASEPWDAVTIEPEYGVAAIDPPPFEYDVTRGADAIATSECESGLCRPVRWRFPREFFP